MNKVVISYLTNFTRRVLSFIIKITGGFTMKRSNLVLLFDFFYILLFFFILNNSFSDIYEYGEISNIESLVKDNWLYIVGLIFIIGVQFFMIKKDYLETIKYMPNKILNFITLIWFLFVIAMFAFSIDLDVDTILWYLFIIFTSLIVTINLRNYGIKIF